MILSHSHEMQAGHSVPPLHVLIVDDDDVDREKLRRLVTGWTAHNFSIMEASSGREAKERLAGGNFDCIILDYRLGDVLGTELIPDIKAHRVAPCSILMVTGLGDENVAVEAMREGAYDYLPKNRLDQRLFRASLENSLQSAESRRKLMEVERQLNYMSFYDGLTGLPNRNLFFDRLNQAILAANRGSAPFTILMMDLNLFKEVNDNLGHEAGDAVISQVGQRLQTVVRKSDTVARLGGDEFAALLIGTGTEDGAWTAAKKISAAFDEPMAVDGHIIATSLAIGIALFPFHGTTAEMLLAKADRAMYCAKKADRDIEISDNVEVSSRNSSVLMSAHLLNGIANRELFLHYQPKINLRTGDVIGVEALVRWNSSQYGLLNPGQFIAVAERSSAIKPLTYSVLDMALHQAHDWASIGCFLPVAVNLSARMLSDETLVERVAAATMQYSLPANILTLEITETALMNDPERARQLIIALLSAGVKISIDDFGAGFTSFKYFRDLDISEIKIDQVFISNLQPESRDASIIQSIATLARGFQVNLIAEGIEHRESWGHLCNLGCELGQGYDICRPLPAEKVLPWLQAWTTGRLQSMHIAIGS